MNEEEVFAIQAVAKELKKKPYRAIKKIHGAREIICINNWTYISLSVTLLKQCVSVIWKMQIKITSLRRPRRLVFVLLCFFFLLRQYEKWFAFSLKNLTS